MLEIRLKYYNSTLCVGFNDWRQIYDVNSNTWLIAKYHNGRLVYGNNRLSYNMIKSGIDKRNYITQEYCPF